MIFILFIILTILIMVINLIGLFTVSFDKKSKWYQFFHGNSYKSKGIILSITLIILWFIIIGYLIYNLQ